MVISQDFDLKAELKKRKTTFVFKGVGYNKKLYLSINYFKIKEKNEFFLTSIFNQNAVLSPRIFI